MEKTGSPPILHEAGVHFLAACTVFKIPFVGCVEEVGLELPAVPLKLDTQNKAYGANEGDE